MKTMGAAKFKEQCLALLDSRWSSPSGNDYSARHCPEGHNRHSRASGNP